MTGRVVVVGVLAGAASGLFGVGGGIVIVPGLVMVAGYAQRHAHGTSLAAILPISLAATVGYATAGEVDVAVAAWMTAGGLVGVPAGVSLLHRLPHATLRRAFAVVLMITAVRLAMEAGDGDGRAVIDAVDAAVYLATGAAAGMLAGLMGVGGGVLMVPILTLLFGFPVVLAKGTSLAVIFPTALVGTIRNVRRGTADLRHAAIVGAGGIVSAWLASQVSLGLDPVVSTWSFAGLLMVVAVRMLRRATEPAPGEITGA